jgi:hypothetical protein
VLRMCNSLLRKLSKSCNTEVPESSTFFFGVLLHVSLSLPCLFLATLLFTPSSYSLR